MSATASYSYTRGSALTRRTNVNAPVDGLRPQPSFGNIIEVISDASSRLHQLQVNVTANPGALLPAFNAPLIRWKRTTLFANYTVATLESNTDGAFAIPPSGMLDTEWGPAGWRCAPSIECEPEQPGRPKPAAWDQRHRQQRHTLQHPYRA